MNPSQLTTITFFHYSGFYNKWWAFKEMGLSPFKLRNIPGLQFGKMLGSGGKTGFSIQPNFAKYGLLCVWEHEENARQFFETHPLFKNCKKHSDQYQTAYLQAAQFHGQWDGIEPFEAIVPYEKDKPVAVITRATINRRKLWSFWKEVPDVAKAVEGHPGLLFSIGVGEWPLLHQVTFSLWEDSHHMIDFAYKHTYHREMVKKAREKGWFKEDLFARLHLLKLEGEWGIEIGSGKSEVGSRKSEK